jgi:hypothetical protein
MKALDIFIELGHPKADAVRVKLLTGGPSRDGSGAFIV